eukprot:4512701-Alexandrium_andersonii.AAC.2
MSHTHTHACTARCVIISVAPWIAFPSMSIVVCWQKGERPHFACGGEGAVVLVPALSGAQGAPRNRP